MGQCIRSQSDQNSQYVAVQTQAEVVVLARKSIGNSQKL
jgi:hypothetical protein